MHPLDNPVWHSLDTRHREFALAQRGVARYPADVAPFLAVDSTEIDHADALAALVKLGESVLIVGPAPIVDAAWELELLEPIAQMGCDQPIELVPGPEFIELGDENRADLLELTALVYPHYFRPRTPDMGRYIGIYDGSRLAAMAGERMGFDGHQEISAVCTHPAYLGRGLAQRLVTELTNASLAAGKLAFLHVSNRNVRAKALYERLGYRQRINIDLWSLRRLPNTGELMRIWVPDENADEARRIIAEGDRSDGSDAVEMKTMSALRASWRRMWSALGAPGNGLALMERLLDAWSEPQRRYHTLQHLADGVAQLEPHLGIAQNPGEVEFALWMHDAVYDVKGKDNERQSAQWAARELQALGQSQAVIGRVHALVMSTCHD